MYIQPGLAPVYARDAGDQAGSLRAGLDDRGRDSDLAEQPGDVLGGPPLPRPRMVTRVGRIDPDQVAADVHDLRFGRPGGVTRLVVAHPPIVPPASGAYVTRW